jgi:glycosyltransferase involved in cell wall biosynthesis
MKILCLQSHPIQYFAPLFKSISKKSFCDFKVYYCTDSSIKGYNDKGFGKSVKWDIPLLEGYEYSFLKNYSPWPGTNLKFYNLINPGIIKAIINEKPDIVWIHGWSYFTIWLAILVCKITGTKIWLKCENPLNQELKKTAITRFIKKIVLQWFLFKLIDKFLYIGEENKGFYLYYKIPENKLVFSPYAIDNDRFSLAYNELKSEKENLKEKMHIPVNGTVLLFSGKLIPKKRPCDLLKAFTQLHDPNLFLIFLGDGELRKFIEDNITKESIHNVIITGFLNQTELPGYYLIADIFILPSSIGETWGLVVNEAMNFGLPVIVSDMVGCAKDLVENGVNGYIYPDGNINLLSQRIKDLFYSSEKRKKFGLASKNKIESYSFDRIIHEIELILK